MADPMSRDEFVLRFLERCKVNRGGIEGDLDETRALDYFEEGEFPDDPVNAADDYADSWEWGE